MVLGALMSMLGLVGGVGMLRERPQRVAVDEATETADEPRGDDGDKRALVEVAVAGDEQANGQTEADEPATPTEPPKPLTVVALGWEVLAPGVLANGGMKAGEGSAFGAVGLDVTFSSVVDAAEIEIRLGRGGDDERGADVALMPLPVFVASYERLRALSPQVFTVVAWSRGRDALVGDAERLQRPTRGEMRLVGEAGSSQALLGLFALEQAGVSPSRVRLFEDTKANRRQSLRAVQRRKSREIDARDLVISTADATHLVPIVAVAPAGLVKRRQAELVAWSRVWMQGAEDLASDPAAAARTLAAESGAPEAVDLIDALGWLEFTDLYGSAQAAGLSGRGAVNLDVLFHRTWDLWRGVGLLTTPPPERVPLTGVVIAELARGASKPSVGAVGGRSRRVVSHGEVEVLLTHRVAGRRLDAEAESKLVAEVGFLAGVFSRSTIEVWVPRSPEAGRRVASHAVERFGLGEGRVVVKEERERRAKVAAVVVVKAAQ